MATNKIGNLKKTSELHRAMNAILDKYKDCNRNFTGDVLKDVEIQKANIEESRKAWETVSSFTARLTKTAMKSDEEFAIVVEESEAYLQSELG